MKMADIVRHRKHNQSSLQIAANSIISETSSNRPSLITGSSSGLPPKDLGRKYGGDGIGGGIGSKEYHDNDVSIDESGTY
jgi:hypothetical protein